MKAIHPDDIERLLDVCKKAYAERHAYSVEYRFLRPDGSVRWVTRHAAPQFDAERNLKGFLGTLLDITDRKAAESARHEIEEMQRQVLDAIPDMVFVEGTQIQIAVGEQSLPEFLRDDQ